MDGWAGRWMNGWVDGYFKNYSIIYVYANIFKSGC